jgi:cytidylate kinase
VFFFALWKYVNYNFIVTFIVDNFAMSSDESRITINKNILNVWHVRLKHLKKQNVRRLVKMSKKMNLIKLITNKNFCESCIVIKQKIESHNSFVIFDKHFLNLMWSDLVQFFVFNDKIKYFVTFLCDFIKRSIIYVLRVKFDTFNAFKHFQQHNEHEDNRYVVFTSIEKNNISVTNLTIIALNTTLNENQSCQKHRSNMKSSNV